MFDKLNESNTIGFIMSLLLGLGFATMFRKICKGKHCTILKSPDNIENDVYQYPNKPDVCVKFNKKAASCNSINNSNNTIVYDSN